MPSGSIGKLVERITIETPEPQPVGVTSVTRSSTTATVTTATAHGYASGDYVSIAGASPAGYNSARAAITVTGASTFTYIVSNALSTPATGSITATYVSDAQGNRAVTWTEVVEVPAEMVPVSAIEALAFGAVPALVSTTQYRFRIKTRADVLDTMRVRWTPRFPYGAAEHTLEIIGVLPEDDGRKYSILKCEGKR